MNAPAQAHPNEERGMARLIEDMNRQHRGQPLTRQQDWEGLGPEHAPRCGLCGLPRSQECPEGEEGCPMRGGEGRDAAEIMRDGWDWPLLLVGAAVVGIGLIVVIDRLVN